MKSLMLLNARKRRKTRRTRRARPNARRRTRRTSRRNPALGSTAAYAANFPASMGKKTRSPRRKARFTVRRFKSGAKAATITIRNPRRRSRRTRRNSYCMNPLGGNILSQVKGVFSKENLTVAGGGVAATILTNYLLSMTKADKTSLLPLGTGDTQKLARIGYAIGIPVLGAILTRKMNPSLAKGMVFGALINGIVEGIKGYAPEATKKALGFAEYLEYTPMSSVGATPGYSAINQFSNVRPMNSAFSNSSAFPADAWGR